ncbi:MAG: hypothetical protein VW124_23025, partial [Paracoccaceae bacterium]
MNKIPKEYLIRRVFVFFLTIWLAATIIWSVPRLTPGDPVSAMVVVTKSSMFFRIHGYYFLSRSATAYFSRALQYFYQGQFVD